MSEMVDKILIKLKNTQDKETTIGLIDEFQKINNGIVDNNENYLSNIDNIKNKKENTLNRILYLEKSLNIIENGCKINII